MAKGQDHVFSGAHARLSLVGRTTMSLFGLNTVLPRALLQIGWRVYTPQSQSQAFW